MHERGLSTPFQPLAFVVNVVRFTCLECHGCSASDAMGPSCTATYRKASTASISYAYTRSSHDVHHQVKLEHALILSV